MKYVALLRGINSGKNPMIKMEMLQKAFQDMGFENVKTVIASGNVIFETNKTNEEILEKKIEEKLPQIIGFNSNAIVRTIEDIEKLLLKNPFATISSSDMRPFVTFTNRGTKLTTFDKTDGFKIIDNSDNIICYVIDKTKKTPDVMAIFDRAFGKMVTTRGWKTIERIVKAAK